MHSFPPFGALPALGEQICPVLHVKHAVCCFPLQTGKQEGGNFAVSPRPESHGLSGPVLVALHWPGTVLFFRCAHATFCAAHLRKGRAHTAFPKATVYITEAIWTFIWCILILTFLWYALLLWTCACVLSSTGSPLTWRGMKVWR